MMIYIRVGEVSYYNLSQGTHYKKMTEFSCHYLYFLLGYKGVLPLGGHWSHWVMIGLVRLSNMRLCNIKDL